MWLFKSKAEAQLDKILQRLEMNMSNNYKDNAKENFRDFEDTFNRMKQEGALKDKTVKAYEKLLEEYRVKMEGFSHKDQKPYWT